MQAIPDRSRDRSLTAAIASPVVDKNATASSRKRTRRQCSRSDCAKVDAGGGFCVAHGGGKKCSFPGCPKGYQTGGFCRQHGGGARCQVGGCNKVDAGRGLCRAHGGGKRCQVAECPKADVGGGFCTAHGGGRRCSELGCFKIDQGGGKCRAHGGARRCRRRNCLQPARGATGFCTEHGGARVCSVLSCRRLVRSLNDTAIMCAMCARNQKQKGAMGRMQPNDSKQVRGSPHTRRIPTLDDSHASILTSLSPMSPSSANVRCDGSQVANCLNNGCSRCYGGECNCIASCKCNRPTPQSTTQVMPTLRRSNVIPDVATPTNSTICASEVPQVNNTSTSRPSLIIRFLLQIKVHSDLIGIEAIVAIVSTISGVRSVHVISENTLPSVSSNHNLESDKVADASSSHTNSSTHYIAVRGRQDVDFNTSFASLEKLQIAAINIIEESAIAWTRKEVVLRVPDIMCPANCGTAVLNAVRALGGVEAAKLHFQHRRLVVRGDMEADAIQSAIADIGFDSKVDAETPLPRRFRFRVDDLSDVGVSGVKLQNVFKAVEGVEHVVLFTDRFEVLVVAMLLDSNPLLEAAKCIGFEMLELAEEACGISMDVVSPSLGSFDDDVSNTPDGKYNFHKCDMRVCPQIGCPRYMTTVAHTAALAVGWAVPGCGMANGGECTCGDSCKCVGCPEHNPAS